MSTHKPKRVLCAHQGSELYGSDRMFISALKALHKEYPDSQIVAHLPEKGPLSDQISPYVSDIIYGDMWVLRRANIKLRNWRGIFRACRDIWRTYKLSCHFDLVYISSVTMIGYIMAMTFYGGRKVLHLHEAPGGVISAILSLFIALSRVEAIYVSQAVKSDFANRWFKSGKVIYNGVEPVSLPQSDKAVPLLERDQVHFLLLGRFGRIKGQPLVIEAVKQMSREVQSKVRIRMVGGVFGDQEHYRDQIKTELREHNLNRIIELHNFADDPSPYYAWSDVVLVPSMIPESFGLVTVEAMSAGRPVIASAHGGSLEIVDDGITGQLFEPRSATALRDAMVRYIENPRHIIDNGEAGLERYRKMFTINQFNKAITSYFHSPSSEEAA